MSTSSTSYAKGTNTGTTINPSGLPSCFYSFKVQSQKCKNQIQQYCAKSLPTHEQCVDEWNVYCEKNAKNEQCNIVNIINLTDVGTMNNIWSKHLESSN